MTLNIEYHLVLMMFLQITDNFGPPQEVWSSVAEKLEHVQEALEDRLVAPHALPVIWADPTAGDSGTEDAQD